MLLVVEVSTIFMNVRWLLFEHGYGQSTYYAVNAILLFFFFILTRIIYMPYILVLCSGYIYDEYGKKGVGYYKGFVITELIIMVCLSMVLNGYWFWLMCKMICRVLSKALQKPADDIEKVELIKADALKEKMEQEQQASTEGSNADELQIIEEIKEQDDDKAETLGLDV